MEEFYKKSWLNTCFLIKDWEYRISHQDSSSGFPWSSCESVHNREKQQSMLYVWECWSISHQFTWHGLPNIEKPLIPARWYKIKFFFLYIIVLKHPSDIQSIKQINKIDENLLFFQFYGCFLFTFHDFIIYAILFAKC